MYDFLSLNDFEEKIFQKIDHNPQNIIFLYAKYRKMIADEIVALNEEYNEINDITINILLKKYKSTPSGETEEVEEEKKTAYLDLQD